MFLVLLNITSRPNIAASATATSPKHTVPRVALLGIYPSYYIGKNGKATGYTYDLTRAVFDDIGIAADITGMPIARAFREVKEGHQDFTMAYKDPAVFPYLRYLGTVGCMQDALFPVEGSGIKSFADIKGKRISFALGGQFDKLFAKRGHFFGLPVSQTENMYRLAAVGRVHAIVSNVLIFEFYRRKALRGNEGDTKVWAKFDTPIILKEMELALAISPHSRFTHLIPEIKKSIARTNKKGIFKAILQKYGQTYHGECKTSPTPIASPNSEPQ